MYSLASAVHKFDYGNRRFPISLNLLFSLRENQRTTAYVEGNTPELNYTINLYSTIDDSDGVKYKYKHSLFIIVNGIFNTDKIVAR